ncbi:hypothetical protein PR003_g2596 [Phytophthora rubi]|uniref:Uncharacterized protein n=1 Tax=Phytophthora rubi TaxID=129364 RepID=A0A6A3P0Q3_9STRA|nr:hypothetical protein PR002_g2533 [Phytophthora rubi]KAE9047260.1 hypothetical protein PR001_g4275 [Phytophthora rubi]KAE9355899.1 hypothetical protein PR003_g2596 [Phytophthora rubi]
MWAKQKLAAKEFTTVFTFHISCQVQVGSVTPGVLSRRVTSFENGSTQTLAQINDIEKIDCMAPGSRYHEQNAAFSPSFSMDHEHAGGLEPRS